MGLDALLGAFAGLVVAAGGIYVAVHGTRRRERKATRKEIDELVGHVQGLERLLLEAVDDVEALERLLLEQRRYIYRLVTLMIDAGMDPPRPPAPSFDPGEYPESTERPLEGP